MIKINLLTEKKQAKVKKQAPIQLDMGTGGRNIMFVSILLLGLAVAVGWSWQVNRDLANWKDKLVKADQELERLKPIREKAEQYERRKELLERKIDLITDLKKKQDVPVHILDQVSRNLPDFLWLNKMSADNNQVSIAGKATTYNAVSNFYRNLSNSGYFAAVTLGRTFEVPEGVAFSLTCQFATERQDSETESEQS